MNSIYIRLRIRLNARLRSLSDKMWRVYPAIAKKLGCWELSTKAWKFYNHRDGG